MPAHTQHLSSAQGFYVENLHVLALLQVGVVERQLNLTPCRHVRIGSALERGISGENLPRLQEVSACQREGSPHVHAGCQ